MQNFWTNIGWLVEVWVVPKYANIVDLVKSFQKSIYVYSSIYLLAKFGVDTAENGPLKVCKKWAKGSKKS